MLLTVLEAHLSPDQADLLTTAYTAPGVARPPGFVRSQLVRSRSDVTLWRIMTLWESAEALERVRQAPEPPAGVLMFRRAGAEPALGVFEVVHELGPA